MPQQPDFKRAIAVNGNRQVHHAARLAGDVMIRNPDDRLWVVIPGRAESANPESRCKLRAYFWIPGPALRAVPE
jgi:hypothetical protein